MYINLVHRPGNIKQRPMFELQQKLAHELHLKTTVFYNMKICLKITLLKVS